MIPCAPRATEQSFGGYRQNRTFDVENMSKEWDIPWEY